MKLFNLGTGRLRKRAISLIEGVLYLVIALAVIVGGIVFFQQASFNRQVNSVAAMMTSVSTYVVYRTKQSSMTKSDPDFTVGDATGWAIKSGAVQADMIDEAKDLANTDAIRMPWGGLVTFYEATVTVNGARTPVVAARMNDVPTGACMRLGHKNAVGDTLIGGRVFALGVEENNVQEDDLAWTSGDVLYMATAGQDTNMADLAAACQDAKRDLVVYYEVAGIPDTLPVMDAGASGGGFPSGPGGGGSCVPDAFGNGCGPAADNTVPCAPAPGSGPPYDETNPNWVEIDQGGGRCDWFLNNG